MPSNHTEVNKGSGHVFYMTIPRQTTESAATNQTKIIKGTKGGKSHKPEVVAVILNCCGTC